MVICRILIIVFLTLGIWSCQKSEPTYQTTSGESIKLSSFRGKWVIINYWASWCAPCYQEVPELNALATKRSKDVVLLGVNYDKVDKETIDKLSKKLGIKFQVLLSDPAPFLGINHIPKIPTSIVIDPKGKVHTQLIGIQTTRSIEHALKS